jgi:hypothetical protein
MPRFLFAKYFFGGTTACYLFLKKISETSSYSSCEGETKEKRKKVLLVKYGGSAMTW